jgi:hypothetical protein
MPTYSESNRSLVPVPTVPTVLYTYSAIDYRTLLKSKLALQKVKL